MIKNEECLNNVINHEKVKNLTNKQVTIIKECINGILYELSNSPKNNTFNILMDEIKCIETKEDINTENLIMK